MEKIFVTMALLAFLAALSSCTTKNRATSAPSPPPPVVEQTVESEPVEEPAVEVQPVEEPAPAPVEQVVEEPAPPPPQVVEESPPPPPVVEQTVEPEPVAEETAVPREEEEYRRSVSNVDVTRETFNEDKAQVMQIIGELGEVMADMDYDRWLTYIDKASVQYWSNRSNLRRASRMLPVRGLRLDTLQDYFTYVFVPSRKERTVDEIRYDSPVSVKAVQVQDDSDVVYYYFNKIDGKWLVHIPPIA